MISALSRDHKSISRLAAVGLLAASLVAGLAPVGRTSAGVLMLVRVPVSSAAEGTYLTTHFDETHNHRPGSVELLLWPGHRERLEAAGFVDYQIVEDDVAGRDAELFARPAPLVELPGPDRSDYRLLSDYNAELQELAKKHPSLVRLLELPYPTLEGRTVYGVEIAANVKSVDGRPTYHVDGMHHSREWPAGEFSVVFAHDLVERYGKDKTVTNLLRRLRVTIVPVVNPDGYDYSRSAPVDPKDNNTSLPFAAGGLESYWRKNRRSFSGVTVPVAQKNPDAYGVDPNRNYAYLWGDTQGGSSDIPFDQTYRGAAPFSEPESQNIRDIVLSRHVTGLISNHTYGRMVLREWAHTMEDTPDEAAQAAIGQEMADAMGGYRNIKGIQNYLTSGSTDDWSYATTGGFGYTFEHGAAFHPPYGEGVGDVYDGVLNAFMIMAEASANPRYHSVIKLRALDRSGKPVPAKAYIFKKFETPLWEGNPTGQESIEEVLATQAATDKAGNLEWHVNPSTSPIAVDAGNKEAYTLVVVAGDYGKVLRVVVGRGRVADLGSIKLTDKNVMTAVAEEFGPQPE